MEYEFRTADGRICCKGEHLCPECTVRAGLTSPEPERRTAEEWNRYWSARLGVGSLVFDTPSPYAAGLAKIREALPPPRRWLEPPPPLRTTHAAAEPRNEDVYRNPPSGYAIALEKRRREEAR
jgi:hypothetical protein